MSVVYDETSLQAHTTTAPVTSLPVTIAGWQNLRGSGAASADPSNNGAMTLMGLGEAGVADHVLRAQYNSTALTSANWNFLAQHFDTSSATAQINTPNPALSSWIPWMVVFTSTASRTVYFGNSTPVTDTTSRSAPVIDTLDIGRLNWSTMIQHFRGGLAELALWNVALTAADFALFKLMSAALIRPASLVWYRQMREKANGEQFERGSQNLTAVNGPTFDATSHPTIIYPGASSPIHPNTYRNIRNAIRAQRAA